jgi:uncharacterized membrane protein YebE (DUF533 family)
MGRLGHAMGTGGLGGAGGPLGQILGQLGGGSVSRHGGGAEVDILGSLAGMSGGGAAIGGGRPMGRDLMMGGLGALAASILSGRGRGTSGFGSSLGHGGAGSRGMGGAIGAGGLTLLGMLAMRALQSSGQSQQAQPATAPGSVDSLPPDATPPDVAVSDETATLVLRAMIAAAKADGQIDETERQKITAKLQESGADQDSLAYVQREMERPRDLDGLATEVRDSIVAGQVYAASLLAIKVDTPAERDYLRNLAGRLGLEPGTISQLHQALGVPPG